MKHDLEDFYDQRIKQSLGYIWQPLPMFWFAVCTFLYVVQVSSASNTFIPATVIWVIALLLSSRIRRAVFGTIRTYRHKRIALRHPAIVTKRIWNAHDAVEDNLASHRQKKFSPGVLRKMIRIYYELDRLSTPELAKLREETGLTNPYADEFRAGKTLREGLINAIYAGRLEAEEVKEKATEEERRHKEHEAMAAYAPQRRKERELEKEALEQELEKYTGKRTQSEPQELKALSGQYVIHSMDGEKARVVFTLASGEYIAELYDYREKKQDAESFIIEQDGSTYVLKLNGRGFSEHTEITLINKERGTREEITLW